MQLSAEVGVVSLAVIWVVASALPTYLEAEGALTKRQSMIATILGSLLGLLLLGAIGLLLLRDEPGASLFFVGLFAFFLVAWTLYLTALGKREYGDWAAYWRLFRFGSAVVVPVAPTEKPAIATKPSDAPCATLPVSIEWNKSFVPANIEVSSDEIRLEFADRHSPATRFPRSEVVAIRMRHGYVFKRFTLELSRQRTRRFVVDPQIPMRAAFVHAGYPVIDLGETWGRRLEQSLLRLIRRAF